MKDIIKKPTSLIYKITISGLFLSLIIIGAFIRIPFPVIPITLQTLMVLLAAMFLGPKLSSLTVTVYIAMGLAGVPVFTSGGGLGYLLKPTFGYLLGFLAAAFLVGLLTQNGIKAISFIRYMISGIVGIVVIYIFGIGYNFLLSTLLSSVASPMNFMLSIQFPFMILGDIAKCIAAALLAARLKPILVKSGKI